MDNVIFETKNIELFTGAAEKKSKKLFRNKRVEIVDFSQLLTVISQQTRLAHDKEVGETRIATNDEDKEIREMRIPPAACGPLSECAAERRVMQVF